MKPLQLDNYRIYWRHVLPMSYVKRMDGQRVHTTGKTVCYIEEGSVLRAEGHAVCSEKDLFNKEKGRKVSLARALQPLKHRLTKEQRAEIWDMFRKLTKQPKWGKKDYVHVSEIPQETRDSQTESMYKILSGIKEGLKDG